LATNTLPTNLLQLSFIATILSRYFFGKIHSFKKNAFLRLAVGLISDSNRLHRGVKNLLKTCSFLLIFAQKAHIFAKKMQKSAKTCSFLPPFLS
jgi:hypothetical protein